ncbi:MAG: molecular chaperone DnaK [Francisellaceae bacterium]|jgi:molecular chaperone DnaK
MKVIEMNEIILGIDLGTTNSEVGIFQSGKIQIFKDNGGRQVIPSVICFDGSGKLLVGEEARNLSPLFPESSVTSVKRLMGKGESITILDDSYSPQEISAMILKELKKIAEQELGQSVSKAVITVPAYFDDNQRQATKDAGSIAGLEVVRLINEPTAAALSYDGGSTKSQTVLVYDLGGGTFDVSIVDIKDSLIEVIASTGDNHLGGDDFDKKLEEYILAKIETEKEVSITDRKALARISRVSESVKIALSDEPYAQVKEEYLSEKNGSPIHVDFEISRKDYEDLISSLVEKTLESVYQALEEANKAIEDIDEILLVGGSTRTPIIRSRLKDLFKKQPRIDIHPDLCVAMGAAMQGGVIAGEKQTKILIDITPHAFGTTSINPDSFELDYQILIEKNSPLPISKSEVYYPLYEDQEKVIFSVYQGEDEDYQKNVALGEFDLNFTKNSKNDKAVICNFNLDLNGILTVTGTEKATGKKEVIVIENSLSENIIQISEARSKINEISGDSDPIEESNSSIKLIKEIEDKLDTFSSDDCASAKELIVDLQEAIESEDNDEIESLTDALSDLKFYIESNV